MNSVQLVGSFDNWEMKHGMSYDHITSMWFTTKDLVKGKYTYKYVINGKIWKINEEENVEKDKAGNLNNVIIS